MSRRPNDDLKDQIVSAIVNSEHLVTIQEISQKVLGTSEPNRQRNIRTYVERLVENGIISRHGERTCPHDPPYTYGKIVTRLEIETCAACHCTREASDIHDGLCIRCFEMVTQTAPSIPPEQNHLAKGSSRRIRKIEDGLRNVTTIPTGPAVMPRTTARSEHNTVSNTITNVANVEYPQSNSSSRIDICKVLLNVPVKITMKGPHGTVICGTINDSDGVNVGLQTSNGPLFIAMDSIAIIGQWDPR